MSHRLRQTLLVIVFLSGSLALTYKLSSRKHEPKQAEQKSVIPVVQTHCCEPIEKEVCLTSYGLVKPTIELALQPEISSRVTAVSPHLVPGRIVSEGETLLSLEKHDVESAMQLALADFARAELEYLKEEGLGKIAEKDWNTLHDDIKNTPNATSLDSELGKSLALRVPQAKEKKATLEAAKGRLEKAKRDLQRTTISAPFNSVVISERVSLGQRVGQMETVATLVPTERFWVEANLPVEQLKWLKKNDASLVTLRHAGSTRQASLVQVLSNVTDQGRMARLLIAVDDPLDLSLSEDKRNPLLLGSCVQADITGITLSNVYCIPRSSLRGSDSVWILNDDNKLKNVKIEIVYSDAESVYVKGLTPLQRLITSRLSLPVEGMRLKEYHDEA